MEEDLPFKESEQALDDKISALRNAYYAHPAREYERDRDIPRTVDNAHKYNSFAPYLPSVLSGENFDYREGFDDTLDFIVKQCAPMSEEEIKRHYQFFNPYAVAFNIAPFAAFGLFAAIFTGIIPYETWTQRGQNHTVLVGLACLLGNVVLIGALADEAGKYEQAHKPNIKKCYEENPLPTEYLEKTLPSVIDRFDIRPHNVQERFTALLFHHSQNGLNEDTTLQEVLESKKKYDQMLEVKE